MNTIIYLVLISSSFLYIPLFPTEEFETPKAFALISLMGFSLLYVKYKQILTDKVATGLLIFFLSCVGSAVFSLSPYTSLFGSHKMPNGVIIWASYLIFYLIASNQIKTFQDKITLVRLITFTSFIVSTYAVSQAFGYDFKQWFGLPAEHGYVRPPSLLGHPNFMAAYLSMTIPFVSWLFTDSRRNIIQKAICALTIITSIVAIIASQSRGMWWALIISQCVYFGIKRTKITSLLKVGFIALLTLGVTLTLSHKLFEITKERSHLMTDFGGPRLEYLKGAFKIWKKYPILGAGTDSFEVAYQHERTPYYWAIEQNGSPHRAHNELLNILATQGLLGGLAILFLTLMIFNRIKKSSSLFLTPATASITAFYIQEVSSFHCIATMILLLIALCLLNQDEALT